MWNMNPRFFFTRHLVLATLLFGSALPLSATATSGGDSGHRLGGGHRGGVGHHGSFGHLRFGGRGHSGGFGFRGTLGHREPFGYRGLLAYGGLSLSYGYFGASGYSSPYSYYGRSGYPAYYRDYGSAGYGGYPLRRIDKAPGQRDTNPLGNEVGELDIRALPVRLALSIEPAEAALYLDGQFIGTADKLGQLNRILIDAGFHKLEIVHPSFVDEELEFTAEPGDEIELDKRLEPSES